jgi:hypothetical protein
MKVLVTNYTFNASAKTVRFNNYSSIELNRLLLITNATRNTIIYNFANPALGGVVSGNIITLNSSTAGMSNNDALQIFYENEDVPATDQMITLLNRIVGSLRGAQNVDSADRQRITIDGSTVGLSVGNSQLTSITNAGADFRELLYLLDRTNFGSSIRPLLT